MTRCPDCRRTFKTLNAFLWHFKLPGCCVLTTVYSVKVKSKHGRRLIDATVALGYRLTGATIGNGESVVEFTASQSLNRLKVACAVRDAMGDFTGWLHVDEYEARVI